MRKVNQKIRQAIILAAGRGLRLMPYTKNTPKPLMQIAGETLLERQLKQLKIANIDSVTIHTGYLGCKIKDQIGDGSKFGLDINYAHSEELLGAGGGIIFSKDFLKFKQEPFLLLNGDVYTDYDFSNITNIENNNFRDSFKLVLINNPEHNSDGDFGFNLATNKISTKISNNIINSSVNKKNLTYSGIAIISPSVFIRDNIKEITAFSDLIAPYLNDNLITGYYYQGIWHDIGSPDRLDKLLNLNK